MSQATIEKEICSACGADVRPQSDYCYNCGAAVSPSPVMSSSISENESETASVSGEKIYVEKKEKKAIREEFAGREVEHKAEEKIPEREDSTEKILTVERSATSAPEIERTENVAEQPNLKSAAALRRKSKTIERKTVEIVWEEHDNAPNGWFITAAVFLTLLAGGILFLAMYLR